MLVTGHSVLPLSFRSFFSPPNLRGRLADRHQTRAGNGSMGRGSMGQMGDFFGWVTWVMGQCMLTA